MSCSARLPVYTVLIAACIHGERVFGFLSLPGLTLLAMYLLGTVVALLMAWVFKKTLLKSATPMLIMELPPYKHPVPTVVLRHMWDRSKLFLRRAGTIILGINIVLWFLATYPKHPEITREFDAKREASMRATPGALQNAGRLQATIDELNKEEAGEHLRRSFAGVLGRGIAPLIEPLGFDWKMGIGIIGSFAAREVFVSTMSTVYNVGNVDNSEAGTASLTKMLQAQKRPDGSPLYTPLLGITLMVFYVFALQCVSTIVVVRRETNGWKWPAFQWLYMTALAWMLAFVTWHGGQLLGFR
jgi:ferrous iron transport protein B